MFALGWIRWPLSTWRGLECIFFEVLERNRSLKFLVLKYFSPISLEKDNRSEGLEMRIFSAFKSNKQFKSLTLECCDFEYWEFNGLEKCKDLPTIYISRCRNLHLDLSVMPTIRKMPQLTVLWWEGTTLGGMQAACNHIERSWLQYTLP